MSDLLGHADRLMDVAEHDVDLARRGFSTTASPLTSAGSKERLLNPAFRSIEDCFLDLHVQEMLKDRSPSSSTATASTTPGWSSHLNPCSNLLRLLCLHRAKSSKSQLSRLVLVLHPGNDGYRVLLVSSKDDSETELLKFPYEEDYLLNCVDAQELPASLLDLLEASCNDLFYSGCVVVEVRDLRRMPPNPTPPPVPPNQQQRLQLQDAADTSSFVLLRPTTQSLICDSNLLAAKASEQGGNRHHTPEDRLALESQLVLSTAEPLCLDPNPVVSLVAKKASLARQKFATAPMRRATKKFSQVGINRKRKVEASLATPPELRLHEFLQKRLKGNNRPAGVSAAVESLHKHQNVARICLKNGTGVVLPDLNKVVAPPTTEVADVPKFARAIQKRQEVTDMTPHVVEEYVLETAERGASRIYHTRLTIFQRLANDEYLGELYVERDYRENENKGSTCRFVLGTRPHALRYINQFTEIFTEEGRKSVKITHKVPNQQPRVTYTPGMRERMNERERMMNRAQQQQQQAAAAAGQGAAATATTPATSAAATPSPAANNGPVSHPAVLQKKIVSLPTSAASQNSPSPSILQQQLSTPPPAAAQLPLHPLPPRPSLPPPNGPPQPTNILQNQLTIQTGPTPPPQVQLPTTPYPMTPSPAQQQPQPSPASDQQHTPQPVASVTPNAAMVAAALAQQLPSNSNDQEQAISAIMASLIKDSAQFESEKMVMPLLPSPTAAGSSTPGSATTTLVSGAMLPTCPVPPASLAGATGVKTSITTSTASGAPPGNLKLQVNRVSLQTLLSAPVVQKQQQVVTSASPVRTTTVTSAVGSSQLAAHLSRNPVVALPPTYTQALAQQQQHQPPVSPAGNQNRPRLVIASQQQQPSIIRRSLSGSGDQQPKPSLSQDAPGLQALLANAPSADSSNDSSSHSAPSTPLSSGGSLLERLVTGQPVTSPASTPVRTISTPTTPHHHMSQQQQQALQASPSGSADSTHEITLAAILAKPPSSAGSASSPSPTKASPLLQQLQQPVQKSPRQQQQQQQSLVSPVRQQQMSPAPSPRLQQSPRMIQPSPSPRPTTTAFALPPQSPRQQLQQLMHPPVSLAQQIQQQQRPQLHQQSSILSATLQQQQPIVTLPLQDLVAVSQSNGILNGGQQTQNVVSLQNLLNSGMVQVSTSGVSMQQATVTTGGSNMVLQIPGLADPVTLSVNMPYTTQATLQQKQTMVTSMAKFTQPQTVVLQQAGAPGTNSFIQLPQQPAAMKQTVATSAAAQLQHQSNNLLKSGQVLQVQQRPQQQQVFLQMPAAAGQQQQVQMNPATSQQSIQIVRTVRGPVAGAAGGQQGATQLLHLNNALKSPQGMVPPSPSGSSITSPPDGPMEAAAAKMAVGNGGGGNASLGKMRQQRKQSLK
jgi:hypothetical protein